MVYEIIKEAADKRGISLCKVETDCNLGNGCIGKWRTVEPRLETIIPVQMYLKISKKRLLNAMYEDALKKVEKREFFA